MIDVEWRKCLHIVLLHSGKHENGHHCCLGEIGIHLKTGCWPNPRVSAGLYYTKVKWLNSYKFLRSFVLKGTYSIGQLCPNLPKTYRSFNDILLLRCGLIHLLQLNLIFICFKLAYLLWYLELTTRQVFRGHHLFPKKS